jgi:glyoxylase-like metal-dependent hydrolase (beta-lactamase superfamily II)
MINLSALTGGSIVSRAAENFLEDGDRIPVGNLTLEVLYTPGHSRGSICLLHDKLLFSGDTLFNTGIGRTDLPGGNMTELERSIITRIYSLPDDTMVLPGHGDATSIGYEKKHNPYVRPR